MKYTIEDVKKDFEGTGWKVLSTEYQNLTQEMTFECPKGHRVFMPWKKLRGKHECPTCKQKQEFDQITTVQPKPKGVKRTLALDQASKVTGYAIFDDTKLIKYGTFTTTAENDIERFAMVRAWLLSIISSWRPDYIGIEGV